MYSYQARPEVDPIKKLDPRLHCLNLLEKILKKIFKILIFYMKKVRCNPCEYRPYML